VIFSTKES
jgi:hypothetical protein